MFPFFRFINQNTLITLILLSVKKLSFVGYLLVLPLLLVSFQSIGQDLNGKTYELEELREILKDYNELKWQRIEAYLNRTGKSLALENNGVTYAISDIDEKGNPVYIQTDNVGAAVTTGADHLQMDGSLGLDLDGSGVGIAVWDGGKVRESHQEFDGRVLPSDGATENNFHATHVTGTILATGINASAKGMAVNASARTYDFFDDTEEMANWVDGTQDGIIISNHSYGSVAGWTDGAWVGDTEISDQEDYLFGFYSAQAAIYDQIAYAAPYYSIVKSAGNHRGESGTGPQPPDGPYDIIATYSGAKNIMTIGAVQKVTSYSDPESVVMSSFSSWGPTDDGRIKPDFVAAGVGLFSTFETADDDYGSLQGTSMSTPNAAGTFALLQQLHHKLNGGNYMKSALLKALITHTILEAGDSDGPDYEFGWGLIDSEGAANFLLQENNIDKLIIPVEIGQGGQFDYSFTPLNGTKVTATLVWTDVPGTPPSPQLDPEDLMLVNDLDMIITDDSGDHFPWILDPLSPAIAATTGDNFRDNVEKIEFISDGTTCSLSIDHKNSITNGTQEAFLLISYESIASPRTLYWVGGSDNEWTNASNWADETGGLGGAGIPNAESTVIFDNNSLSSASTLTITSDLSISSLVWLSDQETVIDFGANTLTIAGNIAIDQNLAFQGTGNIVITGNDQNNSFDVSLGNSLESVDVIFSDNVTWNLLGTTSLGGLEVQEGTINGTGLELTIARLTTSGTGQKSLIIDDSDVAITESASIGALDSFSDVNTSYQVDASVSFNTAITHMGPFTIGVGGQLEVSGNGRIEEIVNNNELIVQSDFLIDTLILEDNAILSVADGFELSLEDLMANNSESRISITSDGTGAIVLDGHRKICFDDFDVSNVNRLGDAAVTIGTNGTITNSTGWRTDPCDNLLFANFSFTYNCAGSYVYFENLSSGNIDTHSWDFGDGERSSLASPVHLFENEGIYQVILTVSDEIGDQVYNLPLEIGPNTTFEANEIIENSTSLVSSNVADAYQWFRDGEIIDGETERVLDHNNIPGVYFVVTFLGECNTVSDTYEIVALGIEDLEGVKMYPNPSSDVVMIEGLSIESIQITTLSGQVIRVPYRMENSKLILDFSSQINGVYLVRSVENNKIIKFIKK